MDPIFPKYCAPGFLGHGLRENPMSKEVGAPHHQDASQSEFIHEYKKTLRRLAKLQLVRYSSFWSMASASVSTSSSSIVRLWTPIPCSMRRSISLSPSMSVMGAVPVAKAAAWVPLANREVVTMVPRDGVEAVERTTERVEVLALDRAAVALDLYDLADRRDPEFDIADHVDAAVARPCGDVYVLVVHLLKQTLDDVLEGEGIHVVE